MQLLNILQFVITSQIKHCQNLLDEWIEPVSVNVNEKHYAEQTAVSCFDPFARQEMDHVNGPREVL